jgi:hypothetical protein
MYQNPPMWLFIAVILTSLLTLFATTIPTQVELKLAEMGYGFFNAGRYFYDQRVDKVKLRRAVLVQAGIILFVPLLVTLLWGILVFLHEQ